MFWLEVCLDEWEKTKDIRLVERAIPIVLSWIREYPLETKNKNSYAWNDDSTARRCFYITEAYTKWSDYLTNDQKFIIENSMTYHASLLADGSFYTWHHNHGLFQDRALLKYTLVFENPNNKEYQAIAKDRILTYVQSEVLQDGVNAEHSPSYHVNVAMLINTMAEFLNEFDYKYSNMIKSKVDSMLDYSIHLTRPDGKYPPLGDSSESFYEWLEWMDNPQYQYVATQGQRGIVPDEVDRIFPYGGYAIFRSSWEFNTDTDWIMFAASTHSGSHKHHDDLSFMIWHHGNLFLDGGTAGYDYWGNSLALYGVSPWAHSVLVSNWTASKNAFLYKYRPAVDANALMTKITDWEINDTNVSVTGIQKKIKGVEQTRCLEWNKQKNIVTITDTIESERNGNNHMLLFHLSEDITPVIEGNTVGLYRSDIKEAVMHFASSQQYNIQLYYGDEDEVIQGFNAATGQPCYVIGVKYEDINDSLRVQTIINLL